MNTQLIVAAFGALGAGALAWELYKERCYWRSALWVGVTLVIILIATSII